jgi:hypothetical protein
VGFFYDHNDCVSNDWCSEVSSAKGSRKLLLGEDGSEIARVCGDEVAISPFAVDVPMSS